MAGNPSVPLVGVLAVQGDFREHCQVLDQTERCQTRLIRSVDDLRGVDGLVFPGGESTTIAKLVLKLGLFEPLKELQKGDFPVLATCAGMIFLGKEVVDGDQLQLEGMDIAVRRNAFGRQNQSFEIDLRVDSWRAPYRGIFIRAPWVEKTGEGVEVLTRINQYPVLVKQGRKLAAAFHPELTDDHRLHHLFLDQINGISS